jgi:phenylacetate-CoA ligase
MTIPIISLVAPCLNEEENVVVLTQRFFREAQLRGHQTEIVFVDDGSTDYTWQKLEELNNEFGDAICLVKHASNLGIPQGWLSGIAAAKGQYVCLIDSDLQNPPESVFDLYEALHLNGTQLARGIRIPVASQSMSRVLMSRFLNGLLNLIFGMKSRDNKSGFILGYRDLVSKIVHHQGHYKHFQTFIGVAAKAHKFSVIEIETPFEDRRAGISFLSGKSFRVIRQVLADIPEAKREFGMRTKGKI